MRRHRPLRLLLLVFAAAALLGLAGSAVMFSLWSDAEAADAAAAEQAFERVLASCGDPRPYLRVHEDGRVRVDRGLERPTPAELSRLTLLAWDPEGETLLRLALPWWFVRAKMTRSLNLGTLTTLLAGDWGNLDLRVTESDLEHRGAGLVLDRRLADGRRLMLWTEAGPR